MSRIALLLCLTLSSAAWGAAPKKAEPVLPGEKAQLVESAVALETADEARQVAEAYLAAAAGKGERGALETLLGGATLRAREFRLEGYKIVGREKHKLEKGKVEDLLAFVEAIDATGRAGLSQLAQGMELSEITAEEAMQIVKLTRQRAKAFLATHPVFAYLARVDKPVYWHPENPFRTLLAQAGAKGEYTAELDLFWIETARGQAVRKWPLRVVRFQSGGQDSGLKILPASDWNAE